MLRLRNGARAIQDSQTPGRKPSHDTGQQRAKPRVSGASPAEPERNPQLRSTASIPKPGIWMISCRTPRSPCGRSSRPLTARASSCPGRTGSPTSRSCATARSAAATAWSFLEELVDLLAGEDSPAAQGEPLLQALEGWGEPPRYPRAAVEARYASGHSIADLAKGSGESVHCMYRQLEKAREMLVPCVRRRLTDDGYRLPS